MNATTPASGASCDEDVPSEEAGAGELVPELDDGTAAEDDPWLDGGLESLDDAPAGDDEGASAEELICAPLLDDVAAPELAVDEAPEADELFGALDAVRDVDEPGAELEACIRDDELDTWLTVPSASAQMPSLRRQWPVPGQSSSESQLETVT